MELMLETFNVAKALSEAQSIVKTLANKKRISLDFYASPDLPPLLADEAKFKQVMYNLLSNAIKFTPEGGKVLVTAAVQNDADAAADRAGESLRVAVTDTGIGIQANDQERVFKEFEQADSSYGRKQQGTGLGLALTKRLVELHGGRIWVESEGVEGKGSTFTFLIPILINTGIVLDAEERQRLAGHVQAITSKTEPSSLFTELERLGALSNEQPGTGANL